MHAYTRLHPDRDIHTQRYAIAQQDEAGVDCGSSNSTSAGPSSSSFGSTVRAPLLWYCGGEVGGVGAVGASGNFGFAFWSSTTDTEAAPPPATSPEASSVHALSPPRN